MKKIVNDFNDIPVLIKGMVFAILLMFYSTSCCVTGYCPTNANDTQKELNETPDK